MGSFCLMIEHKINERFTWAVSIAPRNDGFDS
jgi:hypothetical protein